MRSISSSVWFALLALLLTSSVFADLFTIESNKSQRQVQAQFVNAADVVHDIRLAQSLSLTDADHLSIPLPNGEIWTAVKTDSYVTEHGRAWFGELTAFAGGPEGRFMLIALDDGMFLGEFSLGEGRFLIWPHAESREHELIQKAPSKMASCGTPDLPDFASFAGLAEEASAPVDSGEGSFSVIDGAHLKAGGTTTLDILPLYHSALGFNDVQNQYISWVTQANQIFNLSNIPAVYSLVSSPIAISAAMLPGTECLDGIDGSLNWMQERPDVLMRLRNELGGDFVVLAVPPSVSSCGGGKGQAPDDACGVASVPWRDRYGRKVAGDVVVEGSPEVDYFWTQRTFTAMRLGCGANDLTFAHELGHTFGAIHENDPEDLPPAPYSPLSSQGFGYEFQYQGETRATVMACARTDDNNIYTGDACRRVQHFSSATEPGPGGQVIGTTGHDNRQLILGKAPSYGAFRSRGGPTIEILSPSRHSAVGFQSNHFEVVASEVVNGGTVDLSDQVIWRVRTLKPSQQRDHVVLGMGQGRSITDFDFSSLATQVQDGTVFELIAVVEGSSGARASWRIPIQLDFPEPPEASFSETCSALECDFDASASSAFGDQVTYRWTFRRFNCFPSGGRSCQDAVAEASPISSHYFPGYQSYDVTLQVEDSLGRLSAGFTRRIQLTAPAGDLAQVGAWFNPSRSGHGFDLYRNNQDQYVVFWYTYEELTDKPTWYLSDPARIINHQFSANLNKVIQTSSGALISTPVGGINLDFSDPSTAAFRWDFTVNDKLAYGWERFQHLYGTNLRTGAWFDPFDSGWGLQVNEAWSGSSTGSLATLAFYDAAGQPRWVSGFKSQSPVQQEVTIPVSYHVGQNLCPFESCFAGTPSVTMTPAGSVTLDMPLNGNPGDAQTLVTLPDNSRWIRNTTVQRIAGY